MAIQISLQSDREAQEMLYQARSATRRERAHSYSDSLSASSPHTPEPVAVQGTGLIFFIIVKILYKYDAVVP